MGWSRNKVSLRERGDGFSPFYGVFFVCYLGRLTVIIDELKQKYFLITYVSKYISSTINVLWNYLIVNKKLILKLKFKIEIISINVQLSTQI